MKINLNSVIKDIDGTKMQYRDTDGAVTDLTLRKVILDGLKRVNEKDVKKQKELLDLSVRVLDNKGEIDLESDQVVLIKQGINVAWNWVVNIQANDIIEKGKNPLDDRDKGK